MNDPTAAARTAFLNAFAKLQLTPCTRFTVVGGTSERDVVGRRGSDHDNSDFVGSILTGTAAMTTTTMTTMIAVARMGRSKGSTLTNELN